MPGRISFGYRNDPVARNAAGATVAEAIVATASPALTQASGTGSSSIDRVPGKPLLICLAKQITAGQGGRLGRIGGGYLERRRSPVGSGKRSHRRPNFTAGIISFRRPGTDR